MSKETPFKKWKPIFDKIKYNPRQAWEDCMKQLDKRINDSNDSKPSKIAAQAIYYNVESNQE